MMITDPLIFAATSDFAGKTRGKAFPARDLERRQARGVGWVPTNVQITCFDTIAQSPFGSVGDLLLVPDPDAAVTLDFRDGTPVERFMLGDIRTLEGAPWDLCTRSILKAALERLKRVGGVDLVAAFEHEFQLSRLDGRRGEAFELGAFSRMRALGESLMAAIAQAGLKPDTFMREYGADQYEVTVAPDPALRAADGAVILREVVRLVAARHGEHATFSPIRDPAGVGNGVHIHLSFLDRAGKPATYDERGPGGMSAVTASFAAGILRHLPGIIALTAPSAISYLRLTPHRWSAAFNNLGERDREASLRICPVTSLDPDAKARQYNIEFRAADACASPYLALAAIVHAGAQGIEEGLSAPEICAEDLSLLDERQLRTRGYVRLPQSLEEALERFAADETVRGFFSEQFADVYVAHKRGELAAVADLPVAEKCKAYEAIY